MNSELLPPPGTLVDIGAMTVPKAAELAAALGQRCIDFAALVETRVIDGAEVVVFDVEVELPQIRTHPIERRERFAAIFSSADDTSPEVLALREGFPRVPHLNLRAQELPRSLCLYEESYRDLKRRWTAARFVAHLREWLALTAKGSLHQEDQPLEPILLEADGILLIPGDTFSSESSEKRLRIISLREMGEHHGSGKIFGITLRCTAQEHGLIHRRPQTLADLSTMLSRAGVDLLPEVRTRLLDRHDRDEAFLNANLILIVGFPQTRTRGGRVETIDTWAFQMRVQKDGGESFPAPVRVVGEAIGVWQQRGAHVGLLLQPDTGKQGENVLLEVLNPIFGMSPPALAVLNDRSPSTEELNLCAIGVGALGSQVVMNLARAGFGRWTLIDDDLLMPHNVARHLLPGQFVGELKGPAVAEMANSLTDGEDIFTAIPANIFTPRKHQQDMVKALATADVILDMSASVTVARHLALSEGSTARRLSLFMSPTGADSVLLAEDDQRTLHLDELEMQYYRACVHDEGLGGHLASSPTQQRYGQSCRDVTSRLPQHLVALHAAIAARAIPDVLARPAARMIVWRSHNDGSVTRVEVSPNETIRMQIGDWAVVTDNAFLDKVHDFRRRKLPNETGGVLLGSFDVDRHVVYIVDTIPSPPDSEEWPTLYIRGRRGLRTRVDQITTTTQGMLEYIGEWHSHPRGAHTIPSADDQQVFAWITELMDRDGLPALMMIVGDEGRVSCFVAAMESRESLLPSSGAT